MRKTPLLNPVLAALTLLAVPGLRAATYVQNVLEAGPAAYWRFETVNDTSLSNGFVNTFQGNATVTAAGQGVPLSGVADNRALLLDGNGGSVLTGITNQFTFSSNGTFMAWVNFNELPSATGRYVELVVKSHFSSPLDWVMDPNNRLYGYAGDYPPVYCDFNPALATNTWYHLAFTFDNAGGFKRLYVNGVLAGDLPLSPNLTGNTDEIVLGNSPVFTDRSFNGRMDEVALFNRALSGAEIQALFASAGVTTPVPQPAVRLSLEFPHEINALERGQNEYYGLGLNFTMIPAPFGSTNALYSTHTNHSSIIGGPSGGVFGGGGWLYNTLGEAIQEATNGLWTLVLNQGATNEQIYRFSVSVTNLSTNNYAVINVTSPVDGSVGNLPDVPFTWTQSMPWLINNLELDGPTYARATVPPGATSWTNAPTLNLGKHDFNIYLRTNAASWVTLTTPTNAASQTLTDWDGNSQLIARRGIRFRVGYFIPPPPGLQAHLRFDDENWLGFDSSGQDNHAGAAWFGEPPTYSADGRLNGAVSFTRGGWLEFNDAFTPTLGGDFTVAVWVQTAQTAGNDTDQGIDGAGIVGGFVGSWSATNTIPLALNGSKAGFMTGDGNGEQTLHSTNNINNNGTNWVHVAVTRVQATGEKRLYINGMLDASETGNTNLLDGTERVRVGYGNSITYNGRLDDLQIYSGTLSPSAIAYLYANPGEVVTNFTTLGDAVNAPLLPWTTGGDAGWFVETTNTHDNVSAAQSGAIGDGQGTWMETSVTGPGTLTFWWNVSSENGYDYLEFLIDGNWQTDISGESGWEQRTFDISPGSHTLRWRYYKDDSGSSGSDAGFLDQVSFVALTLGDAVNAPLLPWTTGGVASWFGETTTTHDGVAAAQSGAIGDNEESWIETTVTGPGILSFWWNVSSQDGGDYLEFHMDGDWQTELTGDSGWLQQTTQINSGSHTLRWRYYKDGSDSAGLDAGFLDQVSFVVITNTPPVITVNPFNQTNHPGYQVALLAAATSNAAITWEWYKVGSASPMPNATNGLYIPANSGTALVAGNYFAIATNIVGAATTTVATVTFQNAALPPDWSRAFRSQLQGNGTDATTNINLACLLDSVGNIYTVGSLNGTNTFGSDTLISPNGVEETTFLKQTATGTPIWGRCMTNNGNGSSFPRGIAAAPGDGFYAFGLFFGTNWLGTNRLVDTAGGSTYLVRFDANGSNLWVRTIVGTNYNFPTHHTLVSDPAGNVTLSTLVSGYTSFGTTNLFVEGQRGILAQYDANGNVRWLQMPSAWPDYMTYNAGRIYGCMGGGLTNYIGGVTNVSDRRRTLFCLNATNGQAVWVQAFAAYKDQGSPSGFSDNEALVAVSGTNLFVVGSAYGTNVVFGSYSVNFPDTVGQYFARYDTDGNAQLATSFGSQYTWPWAIVADAVGNVYVGADFDTYSIFGSNIIAAPFYETVQFVGTVENRIPGQTCVAKFDRNGNPLWARPAQSSSSYLNSRDIVLASDGVWSCGFFNPIGSFGSLTVYGTVTCVGLPCTLVYHLSGYLAKITDGAPVALPVTLINPQNPGSTFQFQFLSQAGFTHFVESRADVATGLWTLRTNVSGDGLLQTITLPTTNAPEFYRVKTQ